MRMVLPASGVSARVLFGGIGGVLLIICFLLVAFSLSLKKQAPGGTDKAASEIDQSVTDTDVKRVFIKDIDKYGDFFSPEKQTAIEQVLYYYAGGGTPDLYTGVIRTNSFTQTKDSSGATHTKLLVDINPVNVSYTLEISNTPQDGLQPVLIRCAPKDQQKNPSVSCVDGTVSHE